jgi:hypothetical protein
MKIVLLVKFQVFHKSTMSPLQANYVKSTLGQSQYNKTKTKNIASYICYKKSTLKKEKI